MPFWTVLFVLTICSKLECASRVFWLFQEKKPSKLYFVPWLTYLPLYMVYEAAINVYFFYMAFAARLENRDAFILRAYGVSTVGLAVAARSNRDVFLLDTYCVASLCWQRAGVAETYDYVLVPRTFLQGHGSQSVEDCISQSPSVSIDWPLKKSTVSPLVQDDNWLMLFTTNRMCMSETIQGMNTVTSC